MAGPDVMNSKEAILNIAVFGIGNLLLSDDGVGIHAINRLNEEYEFPEGVEIIDGGTKGLDLLPLFENREKVMLIDAANFNKPPGTIDIVEGDKIPAFLSTKLSVHQIGVPDMLFAAKLMQIMPDKISLVGIQPESMETRVELFKTVKDKMDEFMEAILGKLKEWGVEAVRRNSKLQIPNYK